MDPLSQLSPGPTHNGVTLRTAGQGIPVFVVPGMEGTGESCLHLAHPVVTASDAHRFVLVDYGAEAHDKIDDLLDTIAALIRDATDDRCVFWGQSFGNLLAAAVAERSSLPVEQLLLVSPFTRLPNWKVALGVTVLSLTPPALYRATARLGGSISSVPLGTSPTTRFSIPYGDPHPETSHGGRTGSGRAASPPCSRSSRPPSGCGSGPRTGSSTWTPRRRTSPASPGAGITSSSP